METTKSQGDAANQLAIDLRQAGDSRLELQPGFALTGETAANPNKNNQLVFGGPAGEATFNLADWGEVSGTPDQKGNELYTAARHNLRISLPLPPGEGGGEGESKVQIVTCGSISDVA